MIYLHARVEVALWSWQQPCAQQGILQRVLQSTLQILRNINIACCRLEGYRVVAETDPLALHVYACFIEREFVAPFVDLNQDDCSQDNGEQPFIQRVQCSISPAYFEALKQKADALRQDWQAPVMWWQAVQESHLSEDLFSKVIKKMTSTQEQAVQFFSDMLEQVIQYRNTQALVADSCSWNEDKVREVVNSTNKNDRIPSLVVIKQHENYINCQSNRNRLFYESICSLFNHTKQPEHQIAYHNLTSQNKTQLIRYSEAHSEIYKNKCSHKIGFYFIGKSQGRSIIIHIHMGTTRFHRNPEVCIVGSHEQPNSEWDKVCNMICDYDNWHQIIDIPPTRDDGNNGFYPLK